MVARKFIVEHGGSAFDLEYDTDDGFEVLQYQLFSLTSIPPDQQKILGGDENRMLLDDSDLNLISEKLRVVSINEDEKAKEMEKTTADFMTSDEELARILQVLSRRVITTEPALATILSDITRECRKNFVSEMLLKLDERDKSEVEELERNLFSRDDAAISLPGRQSGDKEWRISRSEFGSDDHCSISSSSCPVRRCVDEHVTKIYDAFFPVINQFVEQTYDKYRATKVLENFKRILISLRNSPFKTRRTTINAVSTDFLSSKMLPAFGQLLNALSLKSEIGIDGTTDICLASDPVKTSLALPVVFHALDDLIHNLNDCEKLNKETPSWPLLKLNRICCGFVLASGEELPFGIATSAFDGTRMSKWEEPNGARGCWIIYKVSDNRMYELVSYELMSANDAPERDPMDWIIEGSEDGGSSWRILDKQTSQKFDKRFQRKTFAVKSQSFLANAFRNQDSKEPNFVLGIACFFDVATWIGNRLGKLKDVDVEPNGVIWGSSLRIRVAVNVTKPLKRAMKIRTVLGDEQLVRFTYERLPNFCYFCGHLGHTTHSWELQMPTVSSTRETIPLWRRATCYSSGSF
ncbi:UNVERIFIED_CONTAM: Peptide-N(4)-(N-acetyl-beta-glucosaminyl)asparagine amidase [Sesamum radiatum]|uniref:Peptide-N(4)-(N-acetyl-beta-glucosaminyl)asparagine amidase n=1 Tax=Sesamum radiatum TaxID=300843 RepID=A0AAW2UCD8_SESRA